MTDKNGKPLKVGDKVKHPDYMGMGDVSSVSGRTVEFLYEDSVVIANPDDCTLVVPAKFRVGAKVINLEWTHDCIGEVIDNSSTAPHVCVKFPGKDTEWYPSDCIAYWEPKPEPVGYKADGAPIDLGGIPIVTSEAAPKDEAWLVDTAMITEYLDSEEGQASLKEAFAKADSVTAQMTKLLKSDKGKEILDRIRKPTPVVTALMGGKVESQAFKFHLPEPGYKGMYEDSRELVRKLTRAAVAVLTAPDGIEKASAYARLRDAVKEAL